MATHKFILIMIIPVLVSLYTFSFARWLRRNGPAGASAAPNAAAVYVLAVGSLFMSGFVFWRLVM